MKKVFVRKEGIQFSKNQSGLNFGDPTPIFSEFNYLIDLIYYPSGFDYPVKLYYRTTDDGYIQLAEGNEDKNHFISAQYKRTSDNLKANLLYILKEHIKAHSSYSGYPEFIDSILLTKDEFDQFIGTLKSRKEIIQRKAMHKKTQFISFLEKLELHPRPSGGNEYSWECVCPNSKGNHQLMVSTLNDEWGCGYCRKKGTQNNFKSQFNL